MFEVWPNALIEGSASQELPLPKDFEQLVEDRDAEELDGKLVLGDDVDEMTSRSRSPTRRDTSTRSAPIRTAS